MSRILVLLLAAWFVAGAHSRNDLCADWLVDTFGNQLHCDAWYRDSIIHFFNAATPAPFTPQNLNTSCACGPTAFFVNYLFSGITRMTATWRETFANATIRAYLDYSQVVGANQDNFPPAKFANGTTRCARLEDSMGQLTTTVERLRCELGLHPCAAPRHVNTKRVVQVAINWDEVMDGLDHTFTIQRAGQDEYYLWQGYVANYDLNHWIQQSVVPRWNNPNFMWGPRSRYWARLDAARIAEFVDKLEEIVLAKKTVGDALTNWQDLFWVPIPSQLPPFHCNITRDKSHVPAALMFWSQPYNEDTCQANWAAVEAVAWSPEHAKQRLSLCKDNPHNIDCTY